MAIMKPLPGMRPIDTNGWDTVSAVKIGEMNAAIANAGTSPRSFSAEPGPGMSLSGKFGDWTVGPGGDGHLINLIIPLRDVSVTAFDATHHIDSAEVKVRVRLTLLPAGGPQMESTGTVMREFLLVLDTEEAPVAETAESAPQKVATVLQIDGDEDLPILGQAMFSSGLDRWFNDNLAAFRHVFATVNVAEISKDDSRGGLDWLQLTHVSYAFGHNAHKPENGVLAILGQTEGRDGDDLMHQAQAEMIPEDMHAAICISRSRFLHKMIKPALPQVFDGLKLSDLTIKRKDTGIFTTKEIQLESVEHEGETYDPIMEQFDLTIRDTDILLGSRTRTQVSPGIFSMNETTATYAFGMDINDSGEKTMAFEEVEKPTSREWTYKTKEVEILQIILSVLAVVAGLVAIVATAGTATFAAAIVVSILAGVGSGTIHLIDKIKGGDGPPIDLLLANASSSVTWSTGTRFDPKFMALNGGLQIGGNFTEAETPTAETPGALSEREQFQKDFQDRYADIMAARAVS